MIIEPLDLLRSNLSRVRIPEPTNRIFKHECCVSYDTPRSDGGLFIDLYTFLAFGKDYVGWNYEKTGNPVYLHIKQTKKLVPEDRPSKKPTLLAIGLNGGFDNDEPEYEETHSIVILPEYVSLSFPSVELPEKVRLAVDAILLADGAERKEQLAAWAADEKQVSAYAMNLQQINNDVVIPPSGWKCAKCDKKDNLWLNLTDGMILCGRKNWDGSGGNNHAIEHYEQTRYPLAVKLGTITADLEAAGDASLLSDVYSYPEDNSVLDPQLAQHLAFFGIDFSSLQKTEMTTAERELDQNTNFDWNRIQESGQEVEPIFGPGYTGLVNIGNSCYMAATMQVVFSTRSFISWTKLAHGLLSGKYSLPEFKNDEKEILATSTTTAKQEGIRPNMFKAVIAASHPEFSSIRQQSMLKAYAINTSLNPSNASVILIIDALEFFLHFLDRVEQANAGKTELNPANSFKFGIEDRISCSSGKVTYSRRDDYILSLNIPLHEATNKEELESFHKLKAEKLAEGKDLSGDEIVRPRVPLEACLANFSAPEDIHDFYSTALKRKTTALKTAGFTSFPDYLVLHMRRFVMEAGWVPKKLGMLS
ncbi:hypothetical protein TSUD_372520 [Trifolium subterraneum]|uniref:ubiquitinyl hydrolase 1 n=1 Tax=Trifolium subterraneum TaxID=3900 RepID=A0A2Z6MFQ4_TRISU|nr:hypothetical protein TSUD_372520 [Trifolium subterraneum]